MASVFDIRKGAFDSSEALRLHEAFDIALLGLRATHTVDNVVVHRLARSVVKVARNEPDCLTNDGSIDPVRLAHRAVLRMLQMNAPALTADAPPEEMNPGSRIGRASSDGDPGRDNLGRDNPGKIMLKLFDRTSFAKL